MLKLLVKISLVTSLLTALFGTGSAQAQDSSFTPNVWVGDAIGRPEGREIRLRCGGSLNYITAIRFIRFRGDNDSDFYKFAAMCARRDRNATTPAGHFVGYVHPSASIVRPNRQDGQVYYEVDCDGEPMLGIGMDRYRKKKGDYDTYKFATRCDLNSRSGIGPYFNGAGSTRGSKQVFHYAQCSEARGRGSSAFAMQGVDIQRFRRSNGDYDTYQVRIHCNLVDR